MTESSNIHHGRRFAIDATAGLGLFALITTLVAGTGTFAATLSFDEPDAIALAGSTGSEHSILVLALVFSLLFALNAAFFRHLGRAYTGSTRRKS